MRSAEERKTSAARMYDDIAAEYDQVGPPFFAERGAELVSLLRLMPGERVLDAGCGRGACLFPAAQAVGPAGRVVGIDVSPGMVERTGREVRDRSLTNTTVLVGDAEAPDFGAGEFDVVLSGFVLRMLPDPAAAIRAYRRILKPGGRLGVTYYASGFAERWESVAKALEPYVSGTAPDDGLDTVAELTALLQAAGFEAREVVDEPRDIELPDLEQWWDYLWHSGYRGTMNRLTDRDAAREAAFAAAGRLAEPDGRVRMRVVVRRALATRPAVA